MVNTMEAQKVWTEETITALLNSNDRAVEKAILAIYNRQTEDEKSAQTTRHSNNVGFSGADASTGTYYAQWIKRGNHLTGKHLDRARKMAVKYRKQLLTIAQNKAQKPTTIPPVAPVVEPATSAENTYQDRRELTCDNCRQCKMGTEFYYNGTPVLGLCDECNTRPDKRLQ